VTTKRLPSEKTIRGMTAVPLLDLAHKWFPDTFATDANGFWVPGWTPYRLWKVLRASGWSMTVDYLVSFPPSLVVSKESRPMRALFEVEVADEDDPTDDLIRVALLAKRYDIKHGEK
jgi:hypothetical protein